MQTLSNHGMLIGRRAGAVTLDSGEATYAAATSDAARPSAVATKLSVRAVPGLGRGGGECVEDRGKAARLHPNISEIVLNGAPRHHSTPAPPPAMVRIFRLSPVGVTHHQTRRSMFRWVSWEGRCRSGLAPRSIRVGVLRILGHEFRSSTDSGRFITSSPSSKTSPRTAAKMSDSHGTPCSSSQFGGYICLDAYPTIDSRFSACTKEIIA
jgi:hypothetical protein